MCLRSFLLIHNFICHAHFKKSSTTTECLVLCSSSSLKLRDTSEMCCSLFLLPEFNALLDMFLCLIFLPHPA